jgi:hypothetical protein
MVKEKELEANYTGERGRRVTVQTHSTAEVQELFWPLQAGDDFRPNVIGELHGQPSKVLELVLGQSLPVFFA